VQRFWSCWRYRGCVHDPELRPEPSNAGSAAHSSGTSLAAEIDPPTPRPRHAQPIVAAKTTPPRRGPFHRVRTAPRCLSRPRVRMTQSDRHAPDRSPPSTRAGGQRALSEIEWGKKTGGSTRAGAPLARLRCSHPRRVTRRRGISSSDYSLYNLHIEPARSRRPVSRRELPAVRSCCTHVCPSPTRSAAPSGTGSQVSGRRPLRICHSRVSRPISRT